MAGQFPARVAGIERMQWVFRRSSSDRHLASSSIGAAAVAGRTGPTLVTSNPVESMISIARTTNRNVTRWRDGHLVLRWTAAGRLNAERSFRRVKGYKQMPQLVAALHRHAHPGTTTETHETVGAAA